MHNSHKPWLMTGDGRPITYPKWLIDHKDQIIIVEIRWNLLKSSENNLVRTPQIVGRTFNRLEDSSPQVEQLSQLKASTNPQGFRSQGESSVFYPMDPHLISYWDLTPGNRHISQATAKKYTHNLLAKACFRIPVLASRISIVLHSWGATLTTDSASAMRCISQQNGASGGVRNRCTGRNHFGKNLIPGIAWRNPTL